MLLLVRKVTADSIPDNFQQQPVGVAEIRYLSVELQDPFTTSHPSCLPLPSSSRIKSIKRRSSLLFLLRRVIGLNVLVLLAASMYQHVLYCVNCRGCILIAWSGSTSAAVQVTFDTSVLGALSEFTPPVIQ